MFIKYFKSFNLSESQNDHILSIFSDVRDIVVDIEDEFNVNANIIEGYSYNGGFSTREGHEAKPCMIIELTNVMKLASNTHDGSYWNQIRFNGFELTPYSDFDKNMLTALTTLCDRILNISTEIRVYKDAETYQVAITTSR